YTTYLNIAFLLVAAFLVVRFVRMGGPAMLRARRHGEPSSAVGVEREPCS
ncbi:MAG: permease, partial [Propionibacteriaceae bacterium]